MKIGIAYPAFFSSFSAHIPKLETVDITTFPKYDLIIFSGGEDINPGIYNQKNKSSYINPERDDIELKILDHYLSQKSSTKMLGVCRGHQLLHAKLGGTLTQDLGTSPVGAHGGSHGITYSNSNLVELRKIYPERVNSMHHQGITTWEVGGNLRTVAAYKHVVEISVSPDNFILTTQFHPEFSEQAPAFFAWLLNTWLIEKGKTKTTSNSNDPFKDLIESTRVNTVRRDSSSNPLGFNVTYIPALSTDTNPLAELEESGVVSVPGIFDDDDSEEDTEDEDDNEDEDEE